MRFSIVIPTWEYCGKGVFFLTQLLNSIKIQTFTDFEVVVSDHSENDEIENLCFELSKEFSVVYIRNGANRNNSPANLNVALREATGDIIKVMFQDDFFVEKEALASIDRRFREASCQWLVNGYCHTTNSKDFYGYRVPNWNDRMVEGDNTIGPPSILSFLNEDIFYFDENLVMLMDCDYYYALYKKYGEPCVLADPLVANTSHKDQISRRYNKDIQQEIQIIKDKYSKKQTTMNLENNGERMDIDYYNMNYNSFDIDQKSHYKRYEKARTLVEEDFVVGDMACGSGYGSMMLSERCKEVHGVDIDATTINEVKVRYKDQDKVTFYTMDLLDIEFENKFDLITSFETVEHFEEKDMDRLMSNFHKALKPNGSLLFSTPYNQEKIPASMKWHRTFYITEEKITALLGKYFEVEKTWYQDYGSHELNEEGLIKHFIVCRAKKV